jgi:hypothetical protein
MVKRLDGKLESFYYAFGGEADVYAIVEVPDATTAAAVSLVINSTGGVSLATTPLLTCEEIDKACKRVSTTGQVESVADSETAAIGHAGGDPAAIFADRCSPALALQSA